MSFFYDLNKKLNGLRADDKQITESVARAQAEVKSPARITLEESLKQDMKALMEDASGGMAQSNTLETKSYSAKKAAAGKDIGKPGKNFAKIEKSAAKKYGSKEAGERVAGAVLNKLRAKESAGEKADKDYDKDGKVESPKAEYLGSRIAAGKKAAEKMKEQICGDDEMAEAGLPDIADKGAKMAIARGDKPGVVKASPLKNVGKGLKAFFKGAPEPMDEEQEMIEFLTRKAAPQGAAHPTDYNKSKGADAYNGMWGTGMDKDLDEEMTLEASVSRKHFQQVADLLRNIPDEAKRKEMAMHHASIFAQQNPRFDIQRFGQAAGVDLSECGMWESLKGGQHKLDVDGDGDIGADDLADLRAGHEVDEGFGEMDAWLKQREKEKGTGKFDKRQVSTGTVYTRKFDDAPEDDTDAPASVGGAPRGRGRPAVAKGPERVTAKAYKHKGGRMNETGTDTAALIDKALEQIKRDVQAGDLTAIEELLQTVAPDRLQGFLSELDEAAVEAGKRHFFDKLAPAAKKAAKVVKAVTGGKKKEVDEESTGKEDTKAEKAGKKVAKDIEHDEGNKSKGDNKAEKAGKKVTKDIEYDDKKDKKEEKVDETTTAGSVATVATGKKSSAGAVGKGIYDSWEREFETLLAESVSVKEKTTMAEHAEDGDAETMTITATGDDVARLRDVLAQFGVTQSGPSHNHDKPYANSEECGSCGGVPCQCDELDGEMGLPGAIEFEIDEADMEEGNEFSGELAKAKAHHQDEFEVDGKTYQVKEADAPVSQNSPDYPTNQETSDDALQYSGGLNKPKSTGQTTIPVIASQLRRQVSNESKDSVDSFLSLYQAFKTK